MQKLHKKLMDKGGLYARFHNHNQSQVFQWLVLVLVVAVISLLLIDRARQPQSVSYGLQTQAAGQVLASSEHYRQGALLTKNLLNVLRDYERSSNQATALTDLLDAAETRKQFLLSASGETPDIIVRSAIASGLLSRFPEAAQAAIEQSIKVSGTLTVTVEENLKHERKSRIHYDLAASNGNKYKLYFTGEHKGLKTGDKVTVEGLLLDSAIVVEPTASNLSVTSAALPTVTTLRKVGVILLNFNNTTSTLTVDQARAEVFTDSTGNNGYFPEVSFNNLGLTGALRTDGDVFGTYTIPFASTGPCDTTAWSQAAESAASSDGFVRTNYNSVIYAFPTNQNCFWQGQATLGGQPGIIRINGNSWFELGIIAHEMGHNLGLYHANSFTCRQDSPTGPIVPISNDCTSNEYGDPSDIMGGAAQSHFGNYHKGRPYNGSWLVASNTQTLDPSANPSGTYSLAPIETQTTGVQALRIPRGTDTAGQPLYYYLEFRQRIGFDSNLSLPLVNGVIIRIANGYNAGNSPKIIDTTATTTPNQFLDAPLAVGQTFTDPYIGMSVTTESISPSGAQVSINFTPTSCAPASPSVSLTPATQTATNGQTLTYTLSITNNDSSGCLSSAFDVMSAVPSGWSISPIGWTPTIASGATLVAPVNVTSSNSATSGSYNFSYTAKKITNPSSTGSGSAVFVVQSTIDGTPPAVSITSPVNGATVAVRSTITIAATATDSSGISNVNFFLNNKFIKGCSDITVPYTCSWKVPAQKGVTYQLSATAQDKQGNIGHSSIVSVTAR